MTKKLRITGIVATVLGCGVIISLFIFGVRPDPKAQEFLKSADASEKFSKTQNQGASKTTQVAPLVKQAQAFELYLHPPKPEPTQEEIRAAVHPVIVTPKFTLVGTSINPTDPALSRALIDEPGKGLHWVKQTSQIGHVTIKEIKDGLVIISDGAKTSELVAERPEKISLLRNPPPSKKHTANSPSSLVQNSQQQASPEQSEQVSRMQQEQMDALAKALAAVDEEVQAGKLDPNAAAEKTAQIMEKYTQEMETKRTRISTEESNNLDRLGADLKAQQDGNLPQSPAVNIKPVQQPAVAKPETSSQTSAQTKPVTRQRDPRRRSTRQTKPQTSPAVPKSEKSTAP